MSVRVKICGITNPADAELAASLGADMIGLNFYAKSPRFIDATTATAILQVLPPTVTPVALFVNETVGAMANLSRALSIQTVQTHGDPPPQFPEHDLQWIPGFSVRDAASLIVIKSYLESWRAKDTLPYAILVDAHVPGMHGGTGRTAPWHLLADFQPGVPLILAGGLTSANVAEAIRIVRPFAVDVASGVESSPGKKDAEKVGRFIDAVRASII